MATIAVYGMTRGRHFGGSSVKEVDKTKETKAEILNFIKYLQIFLQKNPEYENSTTDLIDRLNFILEPWKKRYFIIYITRNKHFSESKYKEIKREISSLKNLIDVATNTQLSSPKSYVINNIIKGGFFSKKYN